ncbi:hypothetical protein VTN00DRAFT_8499 [Thermoascus crustaceus]|uniref:uncharacterized protein n=1 Tax=Thermoascus crustaceus TaxID=5088 RepID=UPI003743FB71
MAGGTEVSATDASGLLQTLQGHVEDIRSLLQCGICVRPLYEPYTLACGHTFCYGCLTSWFASGRSHKTCPDCRAQVKSQPAPAYLVRAIVQLFTSRAELLEKGETTDEHREHQRAEAARLEADKANTHPRTGGLFQGSFRERPPVGRPIIDVEDNVARCPVCAWELEDTGCAHCGYGIDAESETGTTTTGTTSSEENTEMSDYTDEIDDFGDIDEDAWNDFYDGIPFEELPFGLQQFHGTRHRRFHDDFHDNHYDWLHNRSVSSVTHDDSEEEDDSDDDDEMASFIDDDEQESDSGSGRSTVVGDHSYTTQELDHESESDVSMSQDASDDSEEESSEDEEPIRPPVSATSRRQRRHNNQTNGSSRGNRGNRNQNSRLGNQNQGNSNGPAGSSVNNAIPVEDSDDSDDDVPIPPSRRTRTARHNGGGNNGGRNNGTRNRRNRSNDGRRR